MLGWITKKVSTLWNTIQGVFKQINVIRSCFCFSLLLARNFRALFSSNQASPNQPFAGVFPRFWYRQLVPAFSCGMFIVEPAFFFWLAPDTWTTINNCKKKTTSDLKWLIRGKREPHSYTLLANTSCSSYTCTTLKHYGSCDDFSENSERGIRVLASCRIIIFRKAVK